MTSSDIKRDGSVAITTPANTVISYTEVPDPALGRQAKRIKTATIETPGGRTLQIETGRAVTLAVSGDPTSITSSSDTVSINGRVYITAYNRGTGTYITTSPAGRQTTIVVDSVGRVLSTQTGSSNAVEYDYDGLGRLVSVSSGARSITYNYTGGHLTSVVDPLTRTMSFGYDAAGRVTSQTQPGGLVTGFSYDAGGNLLSLTPPSRPPHVFGFDGAGLAAGYTPPGDTGSTMVSHNTDGQVISLTLPDGITIPLAYDSAGRATGLTIPEGAVTSTYGTGGRVSSLTAPGNVNLSFGFDGSLPTSTTWSGAIAGTVAVGYNNDLIPNSLTVAGATTTYQHDADGLLVTVLGTNANVFLTRDSARGAVTGLSVGAISTSITYNGFGELATQQTTGLGSTFTNFVYTRDNGGRLIELDEIIETDTTVWTYGYDTPGRLAQVHRNGVLVSTYVYDANGNRTQLTTPGGVVTGTYSAQDRLLTYGPTSYIYSDAGRLAQKKTGAGSTDYTYDVLGNLRRVILPTADTIDYLVDGQSRRVGKKLNGVVQYKLLYLGQLAPVAQLDSSDQVVARFTYASRSNVPDFMEKAGVVYRLVHDHLGSVRLVINADNGTVVQRIDYDEFGRMTQNTNPGFQPFGYAGGLVDEHVELVRFGARDYDPQTGRWTAKDPLGFEAGDPNLYAYVDNNPINYTDPTGECPWCVAAVIGALTDLTVQLAFNNFDLDCVDWSEVLLAGAISGIGVGLAAKLGKVSTTFAGPTRPTYQLLGYNKKVVRFESHPPGRRSKYPDWFSYPHWHPEILGKPWSKWHWPLVEPAVGIPATARQILKPAACC